MAARTALEIINAAEDELGLDRTSSVTAATVTARQMLAHLNATVEEVGGYVDWSTLEVEFIIEIGSPSTVSATLVADSAAATVADSSPFAATPTAYAVSGLGIQNGTRLAAVPNGTTLTLTKTATQSTASTLTVVRDTFALPSDYARPIPQTHWDTRMQWALIGPTSSQFDAWQRNGIVGPYPRRQYRRQGATATAFRIFPPPTSSGDYPGTLSFRYISSNVAVSAAGAGKRLVTADTDTVLFPDRIAILGTKWRWQQSKNFDFGPLQLEYYNRLDTDRVQDQGQVIVPLDGAGHASENWLDIYHVQDGSFPGN
jgi:hypothetical protein